MKHFEQLLEETLQDISKAEPRSAIESRIMARVTAEAKRVSRWRLLSGAVAAGLLVAVLVHAGTQRPMKLTVPTTRVVASRTDCLTQHETCLSAEGATHTSLGRRPRDASRTDQTGLKARHIGVAHRLPTRFIVAHPGRSSRPKLPRNAPLRIAPITVAPLRMEQIELASLTLKNRNKTGETQ